MSNLYSYIFNEEILFPFPNMYYNKYIKIYVNMAFHFDFITNYYIVYCIIEISLLIKKLLFTR